MEELETAKGELLAEIAELERALERPGLSYDQQRKLRRRIDFDRSILADAEKRGAKK